MEGSHGQQQQQQQQQQQAPAVIIVQQPVVVGPGTILRGQPFLRRGVKLNNGTRIGASCIYCLGVFGVVFLFLGLIFAAAGISAFIGILFMICGGGMIAACFKFCHKAKQDYDALPQDHPDRTTYATPVLRPHRGGGGGGSMPFAAAAYQLPPGTQIITSANVQGGGHLVTNYHLSSGSQFLDPVVGTHSGATPYSANIHMSQHLGPSPSTSPVLRVLPEEDKPPSYDEVCKNDRNQ